MDIPVGLFPLYSGRLFRADDATIYAGWEVLLWLNGWKCEKDTKLDKFAPLSYPTTFLSMKTGRIMIGLISRLGPWMLTLGGLRRHTKRH
jgi:hypothetical protein